MRELIRVDGTELELPVRQTFEQIYRLIGCETVDVIPLRHMGSPVHVMLVDDNGAITNPPAPINRTVTDLYHCATHKRTHKSNQTRPINPCGAGAAAPERHGRFAGTLCRHG